MMRDQGTELSTLISYYTLLCQTEGKSRRTVRWYRQKLEYFPNFLKEHDHSTRIEKIGPWEIRSFIHWLQTEVKVGENNPHRSTEDRHLSPYTVQGYVATLRAFFSWGVREGLIEQTPMAQVKTPKVPKLVMPSFTEGEVRRLLAAAKGKGSVGWRNYTMLLVFLDTGVRVGELTGLQVQNLYLY